MRRTIQTHTDLWWKFSAGIGFGLAAAFLLRTLLNDWARFVFR
jgi:hypothetical protein